MTLAVCCVALLAEALIGYPGALFRAFGHPVTWMGTLLAWLDRRWNREEDPPERRRTAGGGAVVVLLAVSGTVAGTVIETAGAVLPSIVATAILGILASACLAQRSLHMHVSAVADALDTNGIVAARHAVAAIVGRETASLDTAGVARAAIESLAENFADGVVAPACWLAVFGLPGGVIYKAINTADSMVGHRSPRYAAFGFCAAKLDDAASWPGARLAALWIVLAAALSPDASMLDAWRIMRRDARGHPSPNAGWPEAAMAGALGVRLAGPRTYAGRMVNDAYIGEGTQIVDAPMIRAALRVYRIACALQIAAVFALAAFIVRW